LAAAGGAYSAGKVLVLPQFNWVVIGPVVLLFALLTGGAFFVVKHVPIPTGHVAPTAQPAEASTSRPGSVPSGIQLSGRVIGTPHVRSDPSSNAKVIEDLHSGEVVTVTACSPTCAWYLVTETSQTSQGWVSSAFVDVQGDEQKLPILR
jgi:hypothetical protein